jgi:RNA polymerase sigma-70 factor (ECF subfamily)
VAGRQSFDEIVRAHGNALSRLAWGYTDNRADHDDLLQEILVAIWRALPQFRGEASERTFVFRVGHNRGAAFVSRRRVHHSLDASSPVADPRPNADERLEQDADRTRLATAVRALPAAQREAVLLRLEGYSIKEIAAMQRVTENNVSVRLTRARDRLRDILGEPQAGE